MIAKGAELSMAIVLLAAHPALSAVSEGETVRCKRWVMVYQLKSSLRILDVLGELL